jgi:hypothetical protein
MRDRILLDGKCDLEEWLPHGAPQGRKSLSEPSRASEKIDYGHRHRAISPLLVAGCD